jgi:putative toxin-antitoxin system antitoxin component (TIGR02293 family)
MTRFNPFDWVSAIRRGFPSQALDSFAARLGATDLEIAGMLGISVRALAGRRRKKNLSPYESERLLRAAKTVARSEDVFGDLANGFSWLKATNISLGGVTPVSLIDTEIGSELVSDVLGRIEHGIVA